MPPPEMAQVGTRQSVTRQAPAGVGRRRWTIGVLLGVGILINYFDRVNISVAAPQLQQEFGLTPVEIGLLFSAFFWSYAILQVPVGMVLDRFGVTTVSRIGAFLWGVASGVVVLATGFGTIFAARILLGVAEAPAFPANSKATGYWFPRSERSLATAIFDAAAKFSNVIGVPLVALAVVSFGWRWGFGLTAILSFANSSPTGSSIAIRAPMRSSAAGSGTIFARAARRPREPPRPAPSRCSATCCATAKCGG